LAAALSTVFVSCTGDPAVEQASGTDPPPVPEAVKATQADAGREPSAPPDPPAEPCADVEQVAIPDPPPGPSKHLERMVNRLTALDFEPPWKKTFTNAPGGGSHCRSAFEEHGSCIHKRMLAAWTVQLNRRTGNKRDFPRIFIEEWHFANPDESRQALSALQDLFCFHFGSLMTTNLTHKRPTRFWRQGERIIFTTLGGTWGFEPVFDKATRLMWSTKERGMERSELHRARPTMNVCRELRNW
jgi:hypothetical protein